MMIIGIHKIGLIIITYNDSDDRGLRLIVTYSNQGVGKREINGSGDPATPVPPMTPSSLWINVDPPLICCGHPKSDKKHCF